MAQSFHNLRPKLCVQCPTWWYIESLHNILPFTFTFGTVCAPKEGGPSRNPIQNSSSCIQNYNSLSHFPKYWQSIVSCVLFANGQGSCVLSHHVLNVHCYPCVSSEYFVLLCLFSHLSYVLCPLSSVLNPLRSVLCLELRPHATNVQVTLSHFPLLLSFATQTTIQTQTARTRHGSL